MRRKTAGTALAVLIAGLALSGCSAKAQADQCAFVVGNGVGDTRQVKHVELPGEKVNKGDDEDYYIPCNARNYIITNDPDAGDRHTPIQARTGDAVQDTVSGQSAGTLIPGTPVNIQLSMFWTPNQDKAVLKDFWAFCRKYSCATSDPAGDNTENFASPGWNGMLRENFPFALQRAANTVLREFKPDVWNQPAVWQTVADKLGPAFMDQIRAASGTTHDFFCSSASFRSCQPVKITVEDISPVDPKVRTLVNDQINIQREAANDIARIKAQENVLVEQKKLAQKQSDLYSEPGYAQERKYDTLLKAIRECKASGGTCIINLGGQDVGVNVSGR